eukprot:SM000009S23547  [mRNA]  locus=s9:635527:637346:- [translate_table: standard]
MPLHHQDRAPPQGGLPATRGGGEALTAALLAADRRRDARALALPLPLPLPLLPPPPADLPSHAGRGPLWLVGDFFASRARGDPRFLTKLAAECVLDASSATYAEVAKRGPLFFEQLLFFTSDQVVGLIMDVMLVSLLTPTAPPPPLADGHGDERGLGAAPLTSRKNLLPARFARAEEAYHRLPKHAFEQAADGLPMYTLQERAGAFLARGVEYGLVGLICGAGGQALSNAVFLASGVHDDLPSVMRTGEAWCLFMATSANLRYQIIAGLERAAEGSILHRWPIALTGLTVILRLTNNVSGCQQFIDLARWFGISP